MPKYKTATIPNAGKSVEKLDRLYAYCEKVKGFSYSGKQFDIVVEN